MKQRLVIFSANYNAPADLDSYRLAIFRHLAAQVDETLFIQATDFFSDVTTVGKVRDAHDLVVSQLKRFRPTAALFVNPTGRSYPVQNYLTKNRIPSLTWFLDHPGIFSEELMAPTEGHQYASTNLTFSAWLERKYPQQKPLYVPFPLVDTETPATKSHLFEPKQWSERTIPISLMGTMWDMVRIPDCINHLQYDLRKSFDRDELMGQIARDAELKNRGLKLDPSEELPALKLLRGMFPSESHYLMEVNSYFSAQDRIAAVRSLVDQGLVVYGPQSGWTRVIEAGLPELAKAYRYENICDPLRLLQVCKDSKLGLNIFHRQNQGGGTNFRWLEYASSGTPIVSNRNLECERLFQSGEAALYYSSPSELATICRGLWDSPALATRMAKNAYEIAYEEYRLPKIAEQVLSNLAIARSEATVARYAKDFERLDGKWITETQANQKLKTREIALKVSKNSSKAARWVRSNGIILSSIRVVILLERRMAGLLARAEARLRSRRSYLF